MKELKNITAEAGTIKARIIEDADGDIDYIRTAAENGCSGGSCNNLIYFSETHAFYAEFAEEIDEILEEIQDNTGQSLFESDYYKKNGYDLRNYLAWAAYEIRVQEIMAELEEEGGGE